MVLIIGILISVSAFSQTTLLKTNKPIIIKDSTGITLLAFTPKQVNVIIKSLKNGDMNKDIITDLQKELFLSKLNNTLFKSVNDSLNKQISSYIEIKINLEQQVSVKQKINEDLNKNVSDYILIEDNLNKEINIYKQTIKRKNRTILKLAITNIITLGLLLFVIL